MQKKFSENSKKKYNLSPKALFNIFCCILALILTVLAFIIILLALHGTISLSKVYHFFYVSKNIMYAILIVLGVIATISVVILEQMVKNFDIGKVKKFVKVLLPPGVLIIVCTVISYAGASYLEPYHQKEQQQELNDKFKFDINIDDLLLMNYKTSDLRNHKNALKNDLIDQIINPTSDNINENTDNYKVYEEKIASVSDYETAYILLRENNLFEIADRDIRVELNEKSINLRLEANVYYKDSGNQNLIMNRLADSGDEKYLDKDYDAALDKFVEGLKWGFISVGTAYEEKNGDPSRAKDRIDALCTLYKKVSSYTSFPPDIRNRAEILDEAFTELKDGLYQIS